MIRQTVLIALAIASAGIARAEMPQELVVARETRPNVIERTTRYGVSSDVTVEFDEWSRSGR
jgi:orotate phosphoribosyltransferase-like protein